MGWNRVLQPCSCESRYMCHSFAHYALPDAMRESSCVHRQADARCGNDVPVGSVPLRGDTAETEEGRIERGEGANALRGESRPHQVVAGSLERAGK